MSSTEPRTAAAVIVAAGSGRRMGGDRPKQYLELAGRPVLAHSVETFRAHSDIGSIVVVLPEEDVVAPPPWLADLGVRLVAGGAERGDSVWAGLTATPSHADPILIHDGARPFVTAVLIDRVLAKARRGVGAVAALPVHDTLKEISPGGRIVATRDRSNLWSAQTPQGFPRELIFDAYLRARRDGFLATDDAAVVEHAGGEVHVVEGSPDNLKITRPGDLAVAEALAAQLLAD